MGTQRLYPTFRTSQNSPENFILVFRGQGSGVSEKCGTLFYLRFMNSFFKAAYKLLPIFLSTICVICLILALVPGRLDSYTSRNIILSALIFITGSAISIGTIGLAIYEIIKIIRLDRSKGTRIKLFGILSLGILFATNLSLGYDLPARLYFSTADRQFERVLTGQVLNGGSYKDIKEIGNFKIADIVVDRQDIENAEAKSVYFITRHVPNLIDIDRYGFAYLPNLSKTFATRTTHLHGKWYIFYQRG
jgi:hypothetical protein